VCKMLVNSDPRIFAYHTENHGSGPARNYGIDHAKGKYLYFPDADDYLDPDAISSMVAAMGNGKYDLVVFGYKEMSSDNKLKRIKAFEKFSNNGESVRKNYSEYVSEEGSYIIQGAPWNKLFSTETVRRFNIKYPPLRRHQDDAFIARYVSVLENVHFIEPVLY